MRWVQQQPLPLVWYFSEFPSACGSPRNGKISEQVTEEADGRKVEVRSAQSRLEAQEAARNSGRDDRQKQKASGGKQENSQEGGAPKGAA